MSSTLTKVLLHIVFSTKHREDILPQQIEDDLYGYIGGVCRRMDSQLKVAGGTANHLHLLVNMGKTVSLSDLMLNIKRDSSKRVKELAPALGRFHWQDGYFAFSIGESGVEDLTAYIRRQKEHHQRLDFRDEVRGLLERYKVEWDEAFVWD
jgi:REP element-mobilizing transposase RayT